MDRMCGMVGALEKVKTQQFGGAHVIWVNSSIASLICFISFRAAPIIYKSHLGWVTWPTRFGGVANEKFLMNFRGS